MKHLAYAGPALAALVACAAYPGQQGNAPMPAGLTADVRDSAGVRRATGTASQQGDTIRVQVAAAGLSPGTYGVHVHTTGRCDPPRFESAGGHWNPTNQQHGKENPQGMHKGDLPNLIVGADGRGAMTINIPGASLAGAGHRLMDADGAALVIHASPDDYRTDPSGNSGARIACGVFR